MRQAVVTVPAAFGTLDREHTEEAARLAGLETLMLLPEPVAAMVGYPGLRAHPDREQVAMIYDFGGGTFDCTIMRARGNQYQVLAKAGERDLGGARIDERIADQLIRPRLLQEGFDLAANEPWARQIYQQVLDAAENAKKSLSDEQKPKTTVVLPHLEAPGKPPRTVRVEITQAELQETIAHFLRAANEQMAIALERAGMTRDDLDMVILVGGSTRLPAIRKAVREFMGETEFDERERSPARRKVLADADPDLLVARGAAIVAASFGKSEYQIELVDILLDTVYLRVPGAVARYQPLFAKGTDVAAARRDISLGWPRGETIALDLYEGETEGRPGAKYIGTAKVGPVTLPPGTPVTLSIRYRTDRALPEVSARVRATGDPLRAAMVYEQSSVAVTASPRLRLARELDLVFCVDTTGSMIHGGHLERFRQHCAAFVRSLPESELDVRLAAISFGDRAGGEREHVYSFTPDHRLFLTRLGSLPENDGGDEPESSLDALDTARRLPLREGETTRRRVVLVTDAPPRAPEGGPLERLVTGLAARDIRVDVVGPFCTQYDAVVAGTGGRHYELDDGLPRLFDDLRAQVRADAGEGTVTDGADH